jgi:4-amino-4-deoxy-L-arabinose transferase-like glycosyltransferase
LNIAPPAFILKVIMLSVPKSWVNRQMAKNLIAAIGAFVLFAALYLWRLGSIVPGLSPRENAARVASSTFGNILDNPLNAPHKILQFIFQLLGFHGAFWMRSVSVLFGLIFIASLYLFLRYLFGKYIAIAGTLLFATTPWVVLTARSASADIMFFSSILLLFSFVALRRTEKYLNLAWIVFVIALAMCVDTPGLIWFLAIAFVFGFKPITKTVLKLENFIAVLGITILILLIAPLIYAMVHDTAVFQQWLGLPNHFSGVMSSINFASHAFTSLTYQMYSHQDYSVGKFAVLSITQSAMAFLGIIALVKKMRRLLFLVLSLLIISITLCAINGKLLYLSLCLPAVAILSAAGLNYLYQKWFKVFPTNPWARSFALILITLLILGQAAFGIRYALLAWPHNLETRKAYVIK